MTASVLEFPIRLRATAAYRRAAQAVATMQREAPRSETPDDFEFRMTAVLGVMFKAEAEMNATTWPAVQLAVEDAIRPARQTHG